MTELITRSGAWLLLQGATHPDTVVTKLVAAPRGGFETVLGAASVVTAIALLILTVGAATATWWLWRSYRNVRALLDRVNADVAPFMRHASSIADNVNYVTTAIRSDVEQVNATIAAANRRLHQAVEVTEQRLGEFNALLQVVQQEAEQAFVSTAAAVRGVRTGAAALSGLDDELENGGEEHGDDDESDEEPLDEQRSTRGSARGQPAARPRLRSRRRRD